jgi:hypothetical protein
MRCTCGKPATITVSRRELPYCQECFEQLISSCIRREVLEGPVRLKGTPGYFLDAVTAACTLARREIIHDEHGRTPGCAETQAAATLHYLLGHTTVHEHHFPTSITLEELQTFFKPEQPVELDSLIYDLLALDKTHPGTIRSITKYQQTR